MNERADLDLGMKVMQLILDNKAWGVSPERIARRYLKSDEPWTEETEAQTVRFMRTPQVVAFQEKDVAEAFEAGLTEDEKLTMAQIEAAAAGLPAPTIEMLKKYGIDAEQAAPPGGNGAAPSVTPQTQGAVRAASPFSTGPGGEVPQEQMVQ